MRTLLVDGDILVYNTLYACAEETEWWKVSHTADKVFEKLCDDSGCTHYIGYLTDSPTNFRIPRATTWEYKGNRKTDDPPPPWKDEIRNHYMDVYGWQEVHGIEADDALTIAADLLIAQGIPVGCATKDKDLKQYPWDLFVDMNRENKVISISDKEAYRNLWKQVLIGDKAVDNIPGLSHAAKYEMTTEHDPLAKASKDDLLGDVGVGKLLDLWDPKDYPRNTLEAYISAYDGAIGNTQEVIDYCEENGICFGEYRFYETFDLIYMLREAPAGVEVTLEYRTVPEVTLGYSGGPRVSGFKDETQEDI